MYPSCLTSLQTTSPVGLMSLIFPGPIVARARSGAESMRPWRICDGVSFCSGVGVGVVGPVAMLFCVLVKQMFNASATHAAAATAHPSQLNIDARGALSGAKVETVDLFSK